jgi:hypothetical protein
LFDFGWLFEDVGILFVCVFGIWENAMMSARRTAQLGLGAACLTLVTSITVLVAGSVEPSNTGSVTPSVSSSHVTPLASGQLASFQSGRLSNAK